MPENILVIEYEPRYTDRVKQALLQGPLVPAFARDGEEAIALLGTMTPRLIVLSSVVPKVAAPDLIREIRSRAGMAQVPILLTVSGYDGKDVSQDASRFGVSDILSKPYSEQEFLARVQQLLGMPTSSASRDPRPEPLARTGPFDTTTEGQLTSNEIFGELLDREPAAESAPRRPMNPKDNVDKMLADTLGGMMPQKKKDAITPADATAAPAAAPHPPAATPSARPEGRTRTSAELDRMLQDTLSGLSVRKTTSGGTIPVPSVPTAPVADPPAPRPTPAAAPAPTLAPRADEVDPARTPALTPDRVPIAQPVLATPPPAPQVEEEEPTDGVKFGQYVLLNKIATGGMAEVWKARMRGVEGFQKIVAIKKILPHLSDNQDFIEMFIDEAKLAAQLNHNNIIHIYDLGKIQSSYYIAMEYVDGSDLKTILKRSGERNQPLSSELAVFVASKIASALDYAHRKRDFEDQEIGLVHRDVSPQNVLISEEGDIKLCDFGIAKAASKASQTQAGALKGKLQYMSPEQAWGRNVDRRSDIFALAAVLFEMLTNRKLFTGENEMSILEQVREAKVVAPSELNDEVTPEIDAIVRKALQKDPADRYQTAGEMARDLDSVLYSLRPTPTSADLAIFMHHLSTSDAMPAPVPQQHVEEAETAFAANELRPKAKPVVVAPAPVPVAAPIVAPVVAAVPAAAPMPSWDAPPAVVETGEKRSPILPIAIGAVVLIGGGLAYFMTRGTSHAPAAATSTVRSAPVTAASPALTASTPATSAVTTSSAVATSSQPATGSPTSIAAPLDPSKVDLEVRKRLAAEKAKLDTRSKEQQAAAAPVPRTPQPVPQQAVAQPAAENRPVPAPAPAPAPVQPVVENSPAPQPQPEAASPARVQTGDLVEAGTGGLVPAHITRQAPASYPQMARMQRAQGSVTLSALVSETGQVLETRIVSGAKGPGLNEAAEQSIRRSTFAPGMKDGVRVKSWATVRVDFKL